MILVRELPLFSIIPFSSSYTTTSNNECEVREQLYLCVVMALAGDDPREPEC